LERRPSSMETWYLRTPLTAKARLHKDAMLTPIVSSTSSFRLSSDGDSDHCPSDVSCEQHSPIGLNVHLVVTPPLSPLKGESAQRRTDYLGRRLPKYHDTTRLHAAYHYSKKPSAIYQSTSDRFGNAVSHATLGVKAGSNAALAAKERTPAFTGCLSTDRHGRCSTVSGRVASLWHMSASAMVPAQADGAFRRGTRTHAMRG